ncbi:S8 family serine peptidase [Shewanella waksmanii]|uniref:S8 family serine peptidase n=1 Tax=Shewanella waksmanii TaxID=213783 RepID=UPI0004AC72AD|nr:protease inhibitor I9 family protein [Shewanella waksmanii]
MKFPANTNEKFKLKYSNLFLAFATFIAVYLPAYAALAKQNFEIFESEKYEKVKTTKKLEFGKESKRFIVELESPASKLHTGNLITLSSNDYTQHLEQQQQHFASSLAKTYAGFTLERSFRTLFNGVVIEGANATLEQIASLPGVKAVYPEVMYHSTMDASNNIINSEAMWNAVSGIENAGKDIRVAVIDTGISPTNPMFADDNFQAPVTNMPTDDYCSTVNANFCNNKLIIARWYTLHFLSAIKSI